MSARAIVVGAGLAGCAAARALAEAGWDVEVLERRDRLGGLCADEVVPGQGYRQIYGPHWFHTRAESVWQWVNRFTRIEPCLHAVGVQLAGARVPLPINRRSDEILGRRMAVPEIIDRVFRPYSEKMWGMAWDELPRSITARVPKRREGWDGRYFDQPFQGVPHGTWGDLFAAALEGIAVRLGVDYCRESVRADLKGVPTVYTGHPDELADFRYGPLPYRSLKLETLPRGGRFFGNYHTINWPGRQYPTLKSWDLRAYSRAGSALSGLVGVSYPHAPGSVSERLYPVPTPAASALAARYAAALPDNIVPAGRCGRFAYMDMDRAILDGWRAAEDIMRRAAS